MIKLFFWVLLVPTRTGKSSIPTPRTRLMLAIFEPIISPRDMFGTCWEMEEMATKVSGSDVPIAINVAPITRGESLIFAANFSTNLTRAFAASIKTIRLIPKIKYEFT